MKNEKHQEWVRITPTLAKRYLEKEHPHNRTASPLRVQMYRRDIENGRWYDNGETIKFDAEGRMIDGGHRLRAIIAADTPVEMLVVWNVSGEGVDRGRGRSALDARRMRGESVTGFYIAAVKTMLRVDRGDWAVALSDADTHEAEAKFPAACQWLREYGQPRPYAAAYVGAFAYTSLSDPDAATAFYKAIVEKANLPPNSAALGFVHQAERIKVAGHQAMRHAGILALHAMRNHVLGIEGKSLRASDEALAFWQKRVAQKQVTR